MYSAISKEFRQKFTKILGKEYRDFEKALTIEPERAIVLNSLKTGKKNLEDFLRTNSIKFSELSFFKNSYSIQSNLKKATTSLEFENGLFNVLSSSSLIPCIALDPKETDLVLDIAASPGNKTALLSQMMNNKGLIVANELNGFRLKRLRITLGRMGIKNAVLTNKDGRKFTLKKKFDKILLDAPCTGESEAFKDKYKLSSWKNEKVKESAFLQKELILESFDLLKTDGIMVYSTCTFSPEENEEVVQYLLEKRKKAVIERIELRGLKGTSGLKKYSNKKFFSPISKCFRIWPHRHAMQGFFACRIRKVIE